MSLLGTCIKETDRDAWLAERRMAVGSSDAWYAIKEPLRLYLQKIGDLPEMEPTDPMLIGTVLQPGIAELYRRKTGAEFSASELFLRSDENPFMTATIDCMRSDGIIVEVKAAMPWTAHDWGDVASQSIPDRYVIQVQHQMAVAGASMAHVAVLIAGHDFRIYPVERHQALIDRLVEIEGEFWDCVLSRTPPTPDAARDADVIPYLFRKAEGWTTLAPELMHDADEYVQLGKEISEREARRKRHRAEILLAMGDCQIGELPDGRSALRTPIKDSVNYRLMIKEPR